MELQKLLLISSTILILFSTFPQNLAAGNVTLKRQTPESGLRVKEGEFFTLKYLVEFRPRPFTATVQIVWFKGPSKSLSTAFVEISNICTEKFYTFIGCAIRLSGICQPNQLLTITLKIDHVRRLDGGSYTFQLDYTTNGTETSSVSDTVQLNVTKSDVLYSGTKHTSTLAVTQCFTGAPVLSTATSTDATKTNANITDNNAKTSGPPVITIVAVALLGLCAVITGLVFAITCVVTTKCKRTIREAPPETTLSPNQPSLGVQESFPVTQESSRRIQESSPRIQESSPRTQGTVEKDPIYHRLTEPGTSEVSSPIMEMVSIGGNSPAGRVKQTKTMQSKEWLNPTGNSTKGLDVRPPTFLLDRFTPSECSDVYDDFTDEDECHECEDIGSGKMHENDLYMSLNDSGHKW
ncbi:uncharacterized protein [Asterias amurensis]|uniref:uncharacterized protein n=1 Tax=Asterias amurensis TaxID=7602 RepID=UPI003AB6E45A